MAKHGKQAPVKLWLILGCVALAAVLAVAAVALALTAARRRPVGDPGSNASSDVPAAATTAAPTTEPSADITTTTDYVMKTLTFSKPTKTKFTTTDSVVAMMGNADPSVPLTMNGEAVSLTDIGGFSMDVSLKPGKNTFTFRSGDQTVTYTITYQIEVLRSVSPTAAQTVDGGGSWQVQAVVRKGARATATFNGQKKTMTPVAVKQEEGDTVATDFETVAAVFALPAAKIGQTQKLAAASVTATYSGLTATKKTGAVTVREKTDNRLVVITRDYAETFAGNAVNDYSRPTSAYLPAGTIDKIVGTGSVGGQNYYRLGCGRWVYTTDAAPTDAMDALRDNALTAATLSVNDAATTLKLASDWRIPYGLVLAPQTYRAPDAAVPDYAITEQTTEYVDITFYYTKTTPDAPDCSRSPLIAGAAWRTDDAGNPVLRLTLRQRGQFYGFSVKWDGNVLSFAFKHPADITKNSAEKPLAGLRIVLDPGHGGTSSGTYGTIKELYEKTLNLDYSKILQQKLTALGATVVMTRTTDVLPDNPTMSTRTAHARNNDTDLLLSIHMNGAASTTASGCTLHYFYEYSYDLAARLTETMRAVETDYHIGNRADVTVWSPFFMARVHDCPAVLIECGFMTNAENMSCLVDTQYRDRMTDAIVNAVVGYFRALPHVGEEPAPAEPPSADASAA